MTLVLDGSGVSRLADRSARSFALLSELRQRGLWPPTVPSIALADCLSGDPDQDRNINRFLRMCNIADNVPAVLARRSAWLRTAAGRGSASDALAVALAEPGGSVLVGDRAPNLEALALFATDVFVERG